ncbi:cell division protein ZapE [Marinomonas sp. 2405UD68-3]|uniref:cell division protein ZapE n=1 Tax=Marinomonas sp. 2405UD68-3 TaxID=3391835 RepID=UPI0039C93760
MSLPSQEYKKCIAQGKITFDDNQQASLYALDQLFNEILFADVPHSEDKNRAALTPRKLGIYLWGQVGRGKTLLMNLFYQSLPNGVGARLHFHHFMANLHKALNKMTGTSDPLKQIAKNMSQDVRVICFDEFFVSDIADAMLLGGLIDALFDEGVYLVVTSNIPIEDLFQSQLQKERFKPTIALLNRNLHSFELSGAVDFRYRLPIDQAIYFTKKDVLREKIVLALFQNSEKREQDIFIHGRAIKTLSTSEDRAWFDFSSLCEGPRSSDDYMALAERYNHIVVSDIPKLSNEPFEHIKARGVEDGAIGSGETGARKVYLGVNDDAVRRFISLVDECYDQRVLMYFHSEVPLDALYCSGSLKFEFRRTLSRIMEMQTSAYLSMV